ncbi:DUF3592 domain-containing protein [endosymbiont of unidentified scaly snail isolate Monju]|uniref:DUF3592 domain-containing protein n=1 Tax=endosymbiont of unidentified scaly snail isolate Monju TaxID=1248727 RepID=UPI0014942013|nr:DUF3592 domain-containing protein [endosymbiont of unidentified scaly snail isolate Monju]
MKSLLGIFFLIGACLLGVDLLAGIKMLNAQSWPRADGTIESSSFVLAGSKPSTTSEKVSYSYQVDGKIHENDRIYFGMVISSRNKPLSYRKGEHVYVFYNPDDPSESVLRTDDTHSVIFVGFAGMAFIGFSLFGYWLERRKA